eukprot:Phypoly_transcript_06537.p1 GENE.Phypoly_transcript_06537~~Phypoly_transcript_06537.p1  ORF type:complete len:487 (+),score=56.86 Phypoly_transcript_06537:227-1687(+)
MNTIVLVLFSPVLFLLSWIFLRFLYCVYNYQIYKPKLGHLPAVKDPWAKLKVLLGRDPSADLWKENIDLAGEGKAFLPVVFIGPYLDMGRPIVMVNSIELIHEVCNDTVFPKLPAFYNAAKSVIGDGLATESGARWKKARGILNPLFYHNKVKLFAKHMTANADELIAFLKSTNGAEVDCSETLSEMTLKVFLDSIFSRKDFDPKWTARHLEKSGSLIRVYALTELLFGSTVNNIFPWSRVINSTRKVIYDKVAALCERARNSPAPDDNSSLLEMLVSIKENGKQLLSDIEIADEAMTLLFAGYDTTRNALAWVLYYLCLHRKELEKVQNEVDRVLNGRTATFDDIPNLPKVKNAVTEGQRLRPGGAGLDRTVPHDTELGGYFIPKGTSIYINFHAAHTDPTLWEDPEAFNPDRFDHNTGYANNFFAFSYGPRNCLGQRFAVCEAVIVAASLLQQFDIQMGKGQVRPTMNVSQEAVGFNCKFIPRR